MIYIVNTLLHGPHDRVLNVLMQSMVLNIHSSCVMIRQCLKNFHPIYNDLKASKIIVKDPTVTILLDVHLKSLREAFHLMPHIKN